MLVFCYCVHAKTAIVLNPLCLSLFQILSAFRLGEQQYLRDRATLDSMVTKLIIQ